MPSATSLRLCALTLAIATLSACGGGGGDNTVLESDCSTSPPAPAATAAATPVATPAAAPATRGDDDNDDERENEREHDKRVLTKASSCPAPSTGTGTTTAAAPADAGSTTPASPAPAPAPGPAPAPALAPAASASALNGKSLYAGNCASCHGGDPTQNISKILRGTSPSNTLGAIASNKGGMGFLSGAIGAAEANDIAAYLAQPGI